MRKTLLVLLIAAASAFGQTKYKDFQTISSSGSSVTFQDNASNGGSGTITFEYGFNGATPSTMSITVQGCGDGGTCTTLTALNSGANPYTGTTPTQITFTGGYAKYKVTATWTGSVVVNVWVVGIQAKAGGGGSGSANFPSTPGIVYNTSSSASRNATSSDINTLMNGGTLTNVTIDGVSPTTLGYMDATSPVQTQLNSVPRFSFPGPSSATATVTHFDFHEGTATTVHDISGANYCSSAACDLTLTSGTPASAVTPPWVTGAGGVGVGIALGASASGLYGLPASIGTACQNLNAALTQNVIRTIAWQTYNPPATDTTTLGTWIQPYILGAVSTGTSNYRLEYYQGGQTWLHNSGNMIWTNDNTVGLHDHMITIPAAGQDTYYIDGLFSASYNTRQTNSALATVAQQLGCYNNTNANGSVSTPIVLTDLLLGTGVGSASDAAQYHAAVAYQAASVKGFQPSVAPMNADTNQDVEVGDSTSQGVPGSGSTLVPGAPCLATGTSTCNGASYPTALNAVDGKNWTVTYAGQPGIGVLGPPIQAFERELKWYNNFGHLHSATVWIGINGLSASAPAPCQWSSAVRKKYEDVFVMTLYSLSNVAATDQVARDPYNDTIRKMAGPCKYIPISIDEDAFVGKDGQNGTSPYWSATGVHQAGTGYAYTYSIPARVKNNYYGASSNKYLTYTASSVTLPGTSRYSIFDTTALGSPMAVTLPDCIGMGGSGIEYRFVVKGSQGINLSPATVTGQTEQLAGGTSAVPLATGNYRFLVDSLNTATSAPGGCNWNQYP